MNKTLIISGASKGIGRATAKLFVEKGYAVINLSRSDPKLNGVKHLTVDLTDPAWPNNHGKLLIESIENTTPDELCLIHNAAQMYKDNNESVTVENLQKTLQINVIAATQLNQLLLPKMADGSSILYVASTLAEKAVPGTCSYVISKHAQLGLMRSTCQDLMGRGIHTASVCPGLTDTEMLRNHVNNDEEILQNMTNLSSYNRLVKPEEIANTLFFCSQNQAINGSIIHANLGQKES